MLNKLFLIHLRVTALRLFHLRVNVIDSEVCKEILLRMFSCGVVTIMKLFVHVQLEKAEIVSVVKV